MAEFLRDGRSGDRAIASAATSSLCCCRARTATVRASRGRRLARALRDVELGREARDHRAAARSGRARSASRGRRRALRGQARRRSSRRRTSTRSADEVVDHDLRKLDAVHRLIDEGRLEVSSTSRSGTSIGGSDRHGGARAALRPTTVSTGPPRPSTSPSRSVACTNSTCCASTSALNAARGSARRGTAVPEPLPPDARSRRRRQRLAARAPSTGAGSRPTAS